MSLSLYCSKAQRVRHFEPLEAGKVGIYLCGPTVQSEPHVGHLRSALVYDQLRRWLTTMGLDVTLVRNVTDIDDKVLANAIDKGEAWWALAYRMELEFNRNYQLLRIAPPTYEPRATASIPEMLELIERLITAGYAYAAEDGSGDVYFAASKWADYGELTNQKIDDMAAADDSDPRGKRDARDFALWKGHKAGEPPTAAWQTRFGLGRPGWHIECSAMSTKYLGSQFDIHGGGLDLRFPHHENELAQSRAAGDAFANYWLHNGLVNVAGQKMSKSLGNSIFARDLFAAGSAMAVRYYLGSAHYRSVLDYHDGVLDEAQAALDRITGFVKRATRSVAQTRFEPKLDFGDLAGIGVANVLPPDFVAALNDDLAVPAAMAAVHEAVRAGNIALEAGQLDSVAASLTATRAMLSVLGIDPLASAWSEGNQAASAEHAALDSLVQALIAERNAARAARDFARADAIRDQLAAAGLVLADGATQTHWSVNG